MCNKSDKKTYEVCGNCACAAVTYLPSHETKVCLNCGKFVHGNIKAPKLLIKCRHPNCLQGVVDTWQGRFLCPECKTAASATYDKLRDEYNKSKGDKMAVVNEDKVVDTLNQRDKVYGSFTDVAATAQALKDVLNQDNLSPSQQEAIDMICSKLARITNGDAAYADSWLDIAGYAKLVYNELEDNGGEG